MVFKSKKIISVLLSAALFITGNKVFISQTVYADAKEDKYIVIVNDVDSVTAKKVDTVMRQGDKAVTLKIKGDKKASKKLLIRLQDEVAKVNVYGVRFDLDNRSKDVHVHVKENGNVHYKYTDLQGNGNVFHKYTDLKYKQSGNYGSYTFSKDVCGAYKYMLLRCDKNYKEIENIIKDYDYEAAQMEEARSIFYESQNEAVELLYETIMADNVLSKYLSKYEIECICESYVSMICHLNDDSGIYYDNYDDFYYDDFYEEKFEQDKIECGLSNKNMARLEACLESCLQNINIIYNKSFTEAEQIRLMPKEEYMYPKIKQKYGASIADYFLGKKLYMNVREINYIENIIYLNMDYKDDNGKKWAWHLSNCSSDMQKMKEVYEGTKGVCADFAEVQNLSLDYFGIRSYIISNHDDNHAVCTTSSVVLGDKEPVIYIWSNNTLFKMTESIYKSQEELYTSKSYDKLYRKLMGNDYPFK